MSFTRIGSYPIAFRCLRFMFEVPRGWKVFRVIKLRPSTTKQYHLNLSQSFGYLIWCNSYAFNADGSVNLFVSLSRHRIISEIPTIRI